MWALLLGVTFGLLTSARTGSAQVYSRSCSFAGVFHVEGSNRYSLTFDEAEKLCKSIGTVLANEEQVREAYAKGLETCRYGWISTRNTTILRHQPHYNCANNQTGVLFLTEKLDQHYDAYCFDSAETSETNCEKRIVRPEDIPAVGKDEAPADEPGPDGEGAGEAVGTDAPVATEPEADQGAAPETTAKPEAEDEAREQPDAAATPDPAESAEAAAPADPAETEEPTATGEPAETGEPAATGEPAGTEEPAETGEPAATGEPAEDGGEDAEQATPPALAPEAPEDSEAGPSEEGDESDPANEEQPTEAEEQPGTAVPAEDPPSGEAVPTPDPAMEGEVQPVDHEQDLAAAAPPLNEASIPIGPHGRMNADVGPTAAGRESGGTPDWLIIIVVVAAIAVILLVCAAVATRNRWCGKQQTLMITSKEASEGNGAAASSARAQERDQEMVTLMNKEKIQENGNTEEFTVITLEESPDKSQLA